MDCKKENTVFLWPTCLHTLMGSIGLGSVLWLKDVEGTLCSICKEDIKSNCLFFLDCPEFKEYFDFIGHNLQLKIIKAWQSCPRLLAEHYCFHLESGVTFLSKANDSETDNSVCQSVLASFIKALDQI